LTPTASIHKLESISAVDPLQVGMGACYNVLNFRSSGDRNYKTVLGFLANIVRLVSGLTRFMLEP